MPSLDATCFCGGYTRGKLVNHIDDITPGSIWLVSQDELRKTDLSHLNTHPVGFIIYGAARFSHSMIRLLMQGCPIVLVDSQQSKRLPLHEDILLDGYSGTIQWPADSHPYEPWSTPPETSSGYVRLGDGSVVELRVSVNDAAGTHIALAHETAALGLIRSEWLRPSGDAMPDKAFYYQTLEKICKTAHPTPVTVRLADFAADKPFPWSTNLTGHHSPLGLKGVRLYDHEPVKTLFHEQLQAIAELVEHYDISLLLPFMTHLQEFHHIKDLVEKVIKHPVAIGAMAETPAAAFDVHFWLQDADFVALGCNDLMQSFYAADRDLPVVDSYLDPCQPAFHRFLRHITQEAGEQLDRVQVCGLLPQLPGLFPLMLGLGYRAFSVEPNALSYLAHTAQHTAIQSANALADAVCQATSSNEVKSLMHSYNIQPLG